MITCIRAHMCTHKILTRYNNIYVGNFRKGKPHTIPCVVTSSLECRSIKVHVIVRALCYLMTHERTFNYGISLWSKWERGDLWDHILKIHIWTTGLVCWILTSANILSYIPTKYVNICSLYSSTCVMSHLSGAFALSGYPICHKQ